MHKFKFLHVRCASPFLKAFLRLILAISPWLLSAILQNLRSLQRENCQVLSRDQKAVKRFQKFQRQDSWKNDLWSKSCINIFFTSEWTRCSILEWWLRWFSQVRKRCEWRVEKKKKLERRLNAFEFCVSNIAKAIDNIFVYSYQYNIKITSDRETSEETANFCLMMFSGIGVDISISDINTAHRVETRKLGFSVILQLWAMFDYGCACLSNWSQIVSVSDQFMLEGCCLFLHLALLSQLLYLNWIMLALCALLLNPGWRWLPLMAQAIYSVIGNF